MKSKMAIDCLKECERLKKHLAIALEALGQIAKFSHSEVDSVQAAYAITAIEADVKLTWSELVQRAEVMGYVLRNDDDNIPYLENSVLTFYEDGLIEDDYGTIIAEDRTPAQMFAVMEAIK